MGFIQFQRTTEIGSRFPLGITVLQHMDAGAVSFFCGGSFFR